jgi:hypothetical protein
MTSADIFAPHARLRALAVSLGFGLWALGAAFFIVDRPGSAPLVIFYALLLFNTYFSVRTFATITPKGHKGQAFMDFVLGLFLFVLPLYFGEPLLFTVLMATLFGVATVKYIFLESIIGSSRLITQKARIDSLGTLLCLFAVAGILLGYVFWTTVLWTIIFLIANIYVLWVRPIYRLDR